MRSLALGTVGAVALAFAIVAACASPRGLSRLGEPSEEPMHAATWRDRPLTWSKLREIEDWLETPAARSDGELYAEALLVLAEGRLTFAEQDLAGLPSPARGQLTTRIEAAEAGFHRVLAQPRTTELQRQRARNGLQRAARVADGGAGTSVDLIARAAWGAARAIPARMTPHQGRWTRITVHHSAEPTHEIGGTSRGAVGSYLQRVQDFHMNDATHRWGDVGYHFFVDPQGRVFEGRSLQWQGAHASGSNNVDNIGVCLLGDYDNERPSSAALEGLEGLLDDLRAQHAVSTSRVYGHSEFVRTQCPGTHLMRWVRGYRG